ncbi:MAG TPA: FAD-dependent oxidoreductase, partial [Candidatus Limnocylindrales bacterium]|nr:FAD-dependent oxidoreductase [Candidatus Limnocylindrales bacterium]
MTADVIDVAIIGAGPAGSTLAAALARRGVETVVLERSTEWHWRAGGVFASPAAVAATLRAGLAPDIVETVTRQVPAMRLETAGGAVVRLTYGA